MINGEAMPAGRQGKYIYGIIKTNQKREFGPIGIGARGDVVYTLCYQDLAAIVSSSPIVKYPVTRDNAIVHTQVLEKAMEEYTVLPARFCTIGEEEEVIIEKVLKSRYQEFIDLITEMEGKIELGVRMFWTDMKAIFNETVEENLPIKQLKDKLTKENEKEFDQKMQELEKVYGERKKLKYIGPVPPYNFVEVVVTW